MRRGNTGYPQKTQTQRQAETALVQLLYGCTTERLASFTADSLAASYGVKRDRVEQLLVEARLRRAA